MATDHGLLLLIIIMIIIPMIMIMIMSTVTINASAGGARFCAAARVQRMTASGSGSPDATPWFHMTGAWGAPSLEVGGLFAGVSGPAITGAAQIEHPSTHMPYYTTRYYIMLHYTIPCHTILHYTVQYDARPHHTTPSSDT
jgi:ABC-type cobalt transport system substrate-binding protein